MIDKIRLFLYLGFVHMSCYSMNKNYRDKILRKEDKESITYKQYIQDDSNPHFFIEICCIKMKCGQKTIKGFKRQIHESGFQWEDDDRSEVEICNAKKKYKKLKLLYRENKKES